jgi:hypothetical protein
MWTSFSTMAGGGVRGKGAGIAHTTMTQAGLTIKGLHPFIQGYRQLGGMTTGIIVGEVIHGIISEYPMNKSNITGAIGNRADIGRSKIPGVSKV